MNDTITNNGDCLAAAAIIAEAYANSDTPKSPDEIVEVLEKSYKKMKELSSAGKSNRK